MNTLRYSRRVLCLGALLLLAAGCAATTAREPRPTGKIPRIVAVPFKHWKGPYFGESCRRDYVQKVRRVLKDRAAFVDPARVREEIRESAGGADFELSESSGLALARRLDADAVLFGVCKPQSVAVCLLEAQGGRILFDSGMPVLGTSPDYALLKLAELLRERWPSLYGAADSSGTFRGYIRPRTIAVLPVMNETPDARANVPVRALCHEVLKLKGLAAADIISVDERLKSAFGSADADRLKSVPMEELAKALGVDALALLKVKRFGRTPPGLFQDRRVEIELTIFKPEDSLSWTAAGFGGKRGLRVNPGEIVQGFFTMLAQRIFKDSPDTPYKTEIAEAFDFIWKQLPTWLQ
ncbi:MAG: GNA1162 family protein [Elusimicrobiota bacterium]|jgi:hypothetical protein